MQSSGISQPPLLGEYPFSLGTHTPSHPTDSESISSLQTEMPSIPEPRSDVSSPSTALLALTRRGILGGFSPHENP